MHHFLCHVYPADMFVSGSRDGSIFVWDTRCSSRGFYIGWHLHCNYVTTQCTCTCTLVLGDLLLSLILGCTLMYLTRYVIMLVWSHVEQNNDLRITICIIIINMFICTCIQLIICAISAVLVYMYMYIHTCTCRFQASTSESHSSGAQVDRIFTTCQKETKTCYHYIKESETLYFRKE